MYKDRAWIGLAFLTFWLISFPMAGFLLPSETGKHLLIFFLLPHVISLFICGRFMSVDSFDRLTRGASIVNAGLSILFPLLSSHEHVLLILIGVTAAPMVIRVIAGIGLAGRPALSAAVGLAAGNALVFFLSISSIPDVAKFFAIGLPLLFLCILKTDLPGENGPALLGKFAPMIFTFYLTGGILYGFVMPQYQPLAVLPGIELLFYMGGAFMAVSLTRRDPELPLAIGIIFGILSFALLRRDTDAIFTNASMFSIQTSFALVDVFVILVLARLAGSIRAIGYGLGTMCLAILVGSLATTHVAPVTHSVLNVGTIVLAVSVLLLYFRGKVNQAVRIPVTAEESCSEPMSAVPAPLPNGLRKRLSDQEKAVISLILQGCSFRETAGRLEISESTVKTYMKRIYEKTGASGKDDLVRKLSEDRA